MLKSCHIVVLQKGKRNLINKVILVGWSSNLFVGPKLQRIAFWSSTYIAIFSLIQWHRRERKRNTCLVFVKMLQRKHFVEMETDNHMLNDVIYSALISQLFLGYEV